MPRKKPPKVTTGLTLLAASMAVLFRTLRSKAAAPPTGQGMVNIAHKQLTCNFQVNTQGKKRVAISPHATAYDPNPTTSPTSATSVIAIAAHSTLDAASSDRITRSSIPSPSPTPYASCDRPSPVALFSLADDDDDINGDGPVGSSVPLSSINRGMKRLESEAIVHLRIGDDITIAVPPINQKGADCGKEGKRIHSQFIRAFK